MTMTLQAEQRRARADGYSGIAITGDVSVVYGEPGGEDLTATSTASTPSRPTARGCCCATTRATICRRLG